MCDDADFRPYCPVHQMSYNYGRDFVCDIHRKENAVFHNVGTSHNIQQKVNCQ